MPDSGSLWINVLLRLYVCVVATTVLVHPRDWFEAVVAVLVYAFMAFSVFDTLKLHPGSKEKS
jgi:hypothetical protein